MKDMVDFFESHQVPYVIVGGIAVNLWGRTRSTVDVDLIIDQHQLDTKQFHGYLISKNYVITLNDIEDGFKTESNISIWSGIYRVDLKGIYNEFARITIDQATRLKITEDFIVNADRPELLIISKLGYGSEQDFEDAAAIYTKLELEKKLDHTFLLKTAENFGVLDRLPILKKITTGTITGEELEELLDTLEPVDFF